MDDYRERLLRLLREKSFRYSPEKPFTLVSGRVSPYYIDCRPVIHNAEGLFLIGEIFWECSGTCGWLPWAASPWGRTPSPMPLPSPAT